jgi:hypothetical protein
MKKMNILLTGLLLVCSTLATLNAQNLYVLENNGQQTSYVINDIGKLYFSTGVLIVEMQGGTSDNYLLSGIRYLNFTDLVQVTENIPAVNTYISLYPNPAEGILHVACCLPGTETVTLEIISLEGRLIYVETIRNGKGKLNLHADVSALPQGLYLCRLRGEKIMITKKFIKN